jgi:hypothetical protein
MKYRNEIQRLTDTIDVKLKNLEFIVQRQSPISEFMSTIEQIRQLNMAVADFIERESMSSNEINRIK